MVPPDPAGRQPAPPDPQRVNVRRILEKRLARERASVVRVTRPRVPDLLAGLTVALVALPQSLAYAELAGVPPVAGLWALLPSLLLAAPFLSARELQVGPVATTSLLAFGTLSALADPGSPEWLALASLLALLVGSIRVLIGLLGWGRVAYLLSRPVLIGFLNGAAILILLSQLPSAFGVAVQRGVLSGAVAVVTSPGAWDPAALGFSMGTVLLIAAARRLHPLIPGVLIALVGALLVSRAIGYQGPVVGGIAEAWPRLRLDLPWEAAPRLVIGAAVLALVGFSEAASIGRDLAARARRPWNPGREFLAQGVANLGAGLFGGFPVGASFSRSALNRMAGARSRWSGFVTGLAVLAAIPLMPYLAPLPQAALAGVIISAVWGLVRLGGVVTVARASRSQGVVAATTFLLTLVLAPRIDEAVLIGVLMAIGQHLRREQKMDLDVRLEDAVLRVSPRGVLWYGSSQQFAEALPSLLADNPEAGALEIDLAGCGRVDYSGAVSVRDVLHEAREAGMEGHLVRVPQHASRWFRTVWRDLA